LTSLSALGIAFKQQTVGGPSRYDHSSDAKVSFKANAAAAALDSVKGSPVVEFLREGSFVFQAQGCVGYAIEDKVQLEREIIVLSSTRSSAPRRRR
jgi:hypothetical protein